MTLFIIFAPSYQYILAWETLYFPVLHHCISSVLCCKPNNHVAQGPKNDYTHAYSHPLSNLSPLQSLFWSLSVLITLFPIFYSQPIASIKSAAYYMKFHLNMPLWQEHSIKNSITLHMLNLCLLFIFLRLLFPWIGLLVYWSPVGAWYLATTPILSSFVSLLFTVMALPHEHALWGSQLHWRIASSIMLHRD